MKVLQVCAFGAPNPGNFIASLTALERELKAKGAETVYAFAETARDKGWCRELCRTHKVYFLPVAKARILPRTYAIFRRIYREEQVDIVHSHFELYDIPATVTAPRGTKVFWHLHDAIKLGYEKGRLSRKLLTRLQYGFFGRWARLLSVSEEHKAFVEQLGFPRENSCYCPNGIRLERIRDAAGGDEERFFLMFGWEVERKGVDLGVEAVRQCREDVLPLLVVGEERCKEYIESCGMGQRVRYSPPVPDVNELYRHAKAFLHISRAEGQSYALIEAVYAGLPVICSDIPEDRFAEVFCNAHFVPNEAPERIAREMEALMDRPAPTEEELAHDRKIIRERYSLEAWCGRIMREYGV